MILVMMDVLVARQLMMIWRETGGSLIWMLLLLLLQRNLLRLRRVRILLALAMVIFSENAVY